MKIINKTPFAAETLPCLVPDGQSHLTVIVKATFDIRHRCTAEPSADQIPVAFGDELYEADRPGVKFEADTVPFKPRADIVLVGHAYPPRGYRTTTGIDVSLRVGTLQRVLRVFGDRQWKWSRLLPLHTTRPVPYAKMPLVYERAFGGMDANGGYCRENLAGKGFIAKPCKKNAHGATLPNIEDPKHLIRHPKDKPMPAGFGFYSRDSAPRLDYLGTFDENWRLQRSPELPADFSEDYYNAAHPDLQVEGYLKGDEPVELRNLSPEGDMRFNLPGITPGCKADKAYETLAALLETQQPDHPDLERLRASRPEQVDVPLCLDTLCLIPDEKRFFMIWRGRIPAFDATAMEIQQVRIA